MFVGRDRVRLATSVAISAAFVGAGIYLLTMGPREASAAAGAAAPPTRPMLYVAASGSDSASCRTRAQACATFQRAYTRAAPGQVVEVAAGSYPGQSLRGSGRRSGPNVVFRPAAGARVTLGGLTISGAQRVTVRGMQTSYKGSAPGARNQEGIFVGPGSSRITLENMDAGSIDSWFADRLTVRGGDYGPCDAIVGQNVCGNNKQDASTNVLIDGALFHDMRFDASCIANGGCHWECMYVNAAVNFTIRNSKFRDCTIYNIFFTLSGPDAHRIGQRNVLIENNWFDTPWTEDRSGGARARATGISLAWCQNSPRGYENVLVRFNSFQRNTGIELDRNASCHWQNVRVVGNLLSYPGNCDGRITYAYNVWTTAIRSGRCSPTDRIAGDGLPYANAQSGQGFDFRLRPKRTIADDLVPRSVPGGCPRIDIDRKRRVGKRCDAGSDERTLR